MGVREEQRVRTRAHLLSVAHRLFADRGYADVGLAEVVATAGVTKGALYHHFDGKLELFRAVAAAVARQVGEQVAARADAEPDAWDGLLAGCEEFLRAATAPAARRVLLLEAPAVLGWEQWHGLDEVNSVAHLRPALAHLLPDAPLEPLVRTVSGALNESARWIATLVGAERDRALAECAEVVRRLLTGYRASSGRSVS
ncbi:TetR/AcrR family transcriptional regulator [Kineococcus sp. SYSU DK003]|uniref:TetR/AcrR family transcriptional regulator n=1 Tax=Kineococcus sp. SYSU DK003 TaxID=3383124 RepID=UPI003D7DD096